MQHIIVRKIIIDVHLITLTKVSYATNKQASRMMANSLLWCNSTQQLNSP